MKYIVDNYHPYVFLYLTYINIFSASTILIENNHFIPRKILVEVGLKGQFTFS